MIPIISLLIAGWLFHRLALAHDKDGRKFAFIGVSIYTVTFLLILLIVIHLFADDLDNIQRDFFLRSYLHELFFSIDFWGLLINHLPPFLIVFIVYKVIEYRWKQQETDKTKNKEELLDN